MNFHPDLTVSVARHLIETKQADIHNPLVLPFVHDWIKYACEMSMHEVGKLDAVHIALNFCRMGNLNPTEELVLAIIKGREEWLYSTTPLARETTPAKITANQNKTKN